MDRFLRTTTGQRLRLLYTPGRQSATGVLIIHGKGARADGHMATIFRQAAKNLNLPSVSVDLPGHGKSGGVFADFVYRKTVRDLEAVVGWMRRRGIIRIAVVGHSLGAALAVSLAARNGRLNPLVLVAPPVHVRQGFLNKYSAEQLRRLSERGYAEYVSGSGVIKRQNKAFFDDIRSVELLGDAAAVRVPALLIYGQKEQRIPFAHGHELLAALGGDLKKCTIIPGADHDFWPPSDQALQRVVQRYLENIFIPPFSPVVNVVVQRKDGRVLFVRRNPKLFLYGGYWHVIAGFLDRGRTPTQQAKLELREETGLRPGQFRVVRLGRPIVRDDPEHARRWKIHPVLVVLRRTPARQTLNWEHTRARWVRPRNFQRMKTVPGVEDTLNALGLL